MAAANRGYEEFPKNLIYDSGIGEGYSTTSNSRHFMAMSVLRKHHIFMHALAGLEVTRP